MVIGRLFNRLPAAINMAGIDSSSPPVLFIVGTAGAGKSSLVTSLQRWSRFLETEVLAVNLDPGAERVHYLSLIHI